MCTYKYLIECLNFNRSSLITETDIEPPLVHNLIDRDVYVSEIDKLKPHTHTLLMMLNEIRHMFDPYIL